MVPPCPASMTTPRSSDHRCETFPGHCTTRRLMRLACIYIATLAGCALGGDDPDATDEQAAGTTQYVAIADFAGIDPGAWFDLGDKLRGEFLASCGGTFCTGAYANYTPLTFNCSVTSKLGSVHDCAWTFAASKVAVDGATAALAIDAPTF